MTDRYDSHYYRTRYVPSEIEQMRADDRQQQDEWAAFDAASAASVDLEWTASNGSTIRVWVRDQRRYEGHEIEVGGVSSIAELVKLDVPKGEIVAVLNGLDQRVRVGLTQERYDVILEKEKEK